MRTITLTASDFLGKSKHTQLMSPRFAWKAWDATDGSGGEGVAVVRSGSLGRWDFYLSCWCGAGHFQLTAGGPRAGFNPVCAVEPEAPRGTVDMSFSVIVRRDFEREES